MKFPTRVRRNERVISIISFLDDDSPFLSFAPVNNDELSEVDKFYVTFGEETSVRIGRQEDSGVLLTDQTVSRRHAIL
jgi:pSer/pThr/pTyr-binding forkhead associated (FHA) protein